MISATMDLISTEERTRTEKFCVHVADVLHAISQPLTVLQVRLDPAVAEEMNTAELRKLVGESSQEVERLCNLFGFMQGFLVAQNTTPDLFEQNVGEILNHVAEGMSLFYQEAGKSLRVRVPDRRQVVLVDRTRMYQALSRILLVAFEVSLPNDIVEMTASRSGDEVSIVIRNLETYRALGKESALKLALAEANIERQGGSLTWTAEPFRVEIALRGVRSFHPGRDGLHG